MRHQLTKLNDNKNTDRGANLVEYALLLALIAVVCIGAVSQFGGATNEPFEEIEAPLSTP